MKKRAIISIMKRFSTIALVLLLVAVFSLPASASAATSPGIKPGSFFYFFDTTFEQIGLFFTFNPEKKARKALEYADERLAEAEAVAEDNNAEAVKTAITGYESNIAFAAEKSKEVKDKGQAENLLTSIEDNTSKNQEALSAILIKVPDEAKEAIRQAIEASKKSQEEAAKQIAELKGEVEQLKQEVAELKQNKVERSSNDEKLEIEKAKLEIEIANVKAENAQKEAKIKAQAEVETKNKAEAIKAQEEADGIKLEIEKETQKRLEEQKKLEELKKQQEFKAQQELQRKQEEAAHQAEQNKTNQINSLIAEYQQKINEIDAQILAINQKYYKDTENLRQEGISASGIEGRKIELAREANRQIELLQLEQESLRLQYLNKINSIQ